MKIVLYHEITPSSLDEILKEGIKRGEEGEKSNPEIRKVDRFLDTHLPDDAPHRLGRQKVAYAYLTNGDKIINIVDGEPKTIKKFMAKSKQALLRVMVEPTDCFVSDLDIYDTLKRAMELDEQDSTREHLAQRYWQRVVRFDEYESGTIKRPEVMIAVDIKPRDIEVVYDNR